MGQRDDRDLGRQCFRWQTHHRDLQPRREAGLPGKRQLCRIRQQFELRCAQGESTLRSLEIYLQRPQTQTHPGSRGGELPHRQAQDRAFRRGKAARTAVQTTGFEQLLQESGGEKRRIKPGPGHCAGVWRRRAFADQAIAQQYQYQRFK